MIFMHSNSKPMNAPQCAGNVRASRNTWQKGISGHTIEVKTVPDKFCPGNCVYCPFGKTTHKSIDRTSFFPTEKILRDLENRLCHSGPVDNVVVAGPGEPTLHSDLRGIIAGIKRITSVPVAVASCGSLLWMKGVQQDLQRADAVFANLDAADKETFHAINNFQVQVPYLRFVNGLFEFRSRFKGDFNVNVCIVDGINSDESHVAALAMIVKNLGPKVINVRSFVSPDSGPFSAVVDNVRLQYLASYFGPHVRVLNNAAVVPVEVGSGVVRKESVC